MDIEFLKQTALDYCLPLHVVKSIYIASQKKDSVKSFYSMLDDELYFRINLK